MPRSREPTGAPRGRSPGCEFTVTDVFISYSRRDSVYVARLAGALRERGKEAWVDTEGLADGEVFPQALRSAIENADAFVPVISPDSTSSVHCGTEVDHAVRLGKRIVPVLLRPVPDEQLPTEIRERNWIPADAGDAADRLVRAVETDLDHVRAHTRWTARAVEWEQSGRDGSLLPRGSDLAAGESWLGSCGTQTDPAPTTAQRELLLTARRAQARRQRRLTTIVAVGLIVSLVLLVFALISRHSAQVARRTADDQRRTATAQALAARSAAAIPVSPRAALELARRAVTVQASATTMRALKQALDAQRLIAAPAAVQTGPSCEDPKPAYSPQSRQLALGSCNGTVRIVDADSGSSIRTLRIGGDASTIAYRPDGGQLAVLDRRTLRLVDPRTAAVAAVVSFPGDSRAEPTASATGIAFSPDGRQVAAITSGQRVILLDAGSRRARTVMRQAGGLGGVAFARNGRQLLVATRRGYVAVVDLRSSRETRRLSVPSQDRVQGLAVSPDGRQLAVGVQQFYSGGYGGYVQLWSTRSWRPETVRQRLDSDNPYTLTYTTDGKQLVIGTRHGAIETVPLTGTRPTFTATMSGTVRGMATAHRGEIAAIDRLGTVQMWRTSGPLQTTIVPPATVNDFADNGTDTEVDSARVGDSGAVLHFFTREGTRASGSPLIVARGGARADNLSEDGRLLLDAAEGRGRARPCGTFRAAA